MTHRRTYLPNINTLACSNAEIEAVLENYEPLLPCVDSLKRDKFKTICLYMKDVQNC